MPSPANDLAAQAAATEASFETRPARRVQRVRHELRRREVQLLRNQAIGASFLSLTFGGDSLVDFASDSFDDHVKFMFDDGGPDMVRRDYTPRHFDRAARELTIELRCMATGPPAGGHRPQHPVPRL